MMRAIGSSPACLASVENSSFVRRLNNTEELPIRGTSLPSYVGPSAKACSGAGSHLVKGQA
jgi:hypothetical protein